MPSLVIDQNKCKQDGLCVAECPMLIIEMEQGDFPRISAEPANHCISCGHCVAVCPHGALSLDFMDAKECKPLDKNLNLSADQVTQFLASRRSCRQYKDQAVPKSDLQTIMEIAAYAPSGHNRQPLDWVIVYDTEEVRALTGLVVDWMRDTMAKKPEAAQAYNMPAVVAACEAGNDRILRSCPHLIIAHAPKDERTAPSTCVGAISYIELAAPSLGLGTCWAGYFTTACQMYEPLSAALQLPEGHQVFGAVMLGYPKAKYYRLPLRRQAEIVWK
jgi:nitroreductase/NAD-dependent dihydropyrimidine dehydrogenase PreA subunit